MKMCDDHEMWASSSAKVTQTKHQRDLVKRSTKAKSKLNYANRGSRNQKAVAKKGR